MRQVAQGASRPMGQVGQVGFSVHEAGDTGGLLGP